MKMEHENNAEDDATSAVAAIVADADNSVSSNAVLPQYNYVRRRKCNENAPICEKKKKRESFRRVSVIVVIIHTENHLFLFDSLPSVFF